MHIKDFGVLPVLLPQTTQTHYIYFKKHDKSPTALFLSNLPLQTTTATVRRFVQAHAKGATMASFVPSVLTDSSEDVYIDYISLTTDPEIAKHLPKPGEGTRLPKHCALVHFVDKPALQLASSSFKRLADKEEAVEWPHVAEQASAHYITAIHERILDPDQLEKDVASALAEFDRAEQLSKENLQAQASLVDEDGFTLVVGSNRKTKADILGKQREAATVGSEKAKSALKKKEKADFYRFQMRQKKKDEMNELLEKFKKDQEKVRVMREKRRFKPY